MWSGVCVRAWTPVVVGCLVAGCAVSTVQVTGGGTATVRLEVPDEGVDLILEVQGASADDLRSWLDDGPLPEDGASSGAYLYQSSGGRDASVPYADGSLRVWSEHVDVEICGVQRSWAEGSVSWELGEPDWVEVSLKSTDGGGPILVPTPVSEGPGLGLEGGHTWSGQVNCLHGDGVDRAASVTVEWSLDPSTAQQRRSRGTDFTGIDLLP
ncbi:MAG: hypothetical protein KTR31_02685 [Myxococcales bacterium]|nr:hypothetical protein [Myxococcales bacterium]